jgi:hypothetical protein
VNLTEFLLARIAEDEAAAQAAERIDFVTFAGVRRRIRPDLYVTTRDRAHLIIETDPARVLAECDAKRRIVAADWRADDSGEATLIRQDVLRLLALPYADHPDYDETWRP